MEHYAPHPKAVFEGYYSKFDLPNGARLAIIISSVPDAKNSPFVISFTYVPLDGAIYQREFNVPLIERNTTGPGNAFELRVPSVGHMTTHADGTTHFHLQHEDFTFSAQTFSHWPWSARKSTPEGIFVYLPLPLHWHVHSLGSSCRLDVRMAGGKRMARTFSTSTATVHQEKNWAHSFPAAHIWLQARSEDGAKTVCCAGGKILGMEAFLCGYRSPTARNRANVDFAPPFSLKVLGLSPFMTVRIDWESRTVALEFRSLTRKMEIQAQAPKGTFFSLSAPFQDGHKENLLAESFKAEIRVKVYESWWGVGAWRLIEEEKFEGASLEFGGEYYGEAGTDNKRN
ncbi:hypothetical protein LTS18_008421 [Coniosporium uncinatum]|uniref:Uncharacterized protein n=1 Tax=Coniosporium uncinatum TaxID=93489 RepID=A0ACC3D1Q0_9PEZI|nr:hypothetical protein LTS18_008421 [Coniosporium uncinatum]